MSNLDNYRRLRIVTIGGGTGASTLLRALKDLPCDITAVVAVTDDGGSSGRLRRDMGILPPGDIRDCLAALAEDTYSLGSVLSYKFPQESELAGHNLGNLLITGLVALHGGDFAAGVHHLSQILKLKGEVLPVTVDDVTLVAQMWDGKTVCGETQIVAYPAPIKCLSMKPALSEPLPQVLTAIAEADYILLGPGSLYTSIITNLLVGKVAAAIAASPAPAYYICNLATQPGEMENARASAYVEQIYRHSREDILDGVIVNSAHYQAADLAYVKQTGSVPIVEDCHLGELGLQVVRGDLLNEEQPHLWRHNIDKLRAVLAELFWGDLA